MLVEQLFQWYILGAGHTLYDWEMVRRKMVENLLVTLSL